MLDVKEDSGGDIAAEDAGFVRDIGDGRRGEYRGLRLRGVQLLRDLRRDKSLIFVSGSSGDFEHEGCRPLNSLVSAESLL